MKKIITLIFMFLLLFSNSLAYTDESSYLWAVPAVNRWKEKGIISGYTDGTFRGNNNITRAELVIIINKLNNVLEENNKRVARDISENDYFFDDVCTAVNRGFVKVDNNGNFRPRDYATREEAITAFANLFNLSYGHNSYEYLTGKFIDGTNVNFDDMDRVAGLVEAGFISGYEDSTLRPKNNITRAEIISMLDKSIKEIYTEGNYKNDTVLGSVIINDENVTLKNLEIRDRIFILDGAIEEPPYIENTNVGKGIVSRIGKVDIVKDNDFETAIEYIEDEKVSKPLLGYIKYDTTNWTNKDVKATLKLDSRGYKVINNDGEDYYRFKHNGTFTFECEKNGVIKTFTALVSNIDKVVPIVKVNKVLLSDGVRIDVTVSDDKLSPIKTIAYVKGDVSSKDAVLGTKIENGNFVVSESGKYTIVAEDEAGNIGRVLVNAEEEFYTVTFYANDGSGDSLIQSFIKGSGDKLALNGFTNYAGQFKGWSTTSDGAVVYTNGQDIIPTENMVLYAIWEIYEYPVTLNVGENGNVTSPVTMVKHGSDLIVTITPDSGYQVKDILLDGTTDIKDQLVDGEGNVKTYTVTNVVAPVTMDVTFEQIQSI